MAKTINLASVLFKCGLGGERTGEKQTNTIPIGQILMALCVIPIVYFVFRAGSFYASIEKSLDKNGYMFSFLLFVISIFILCVGIVSCINSFYLSKNLNLLLTMPYTAGQITGAKFLVAAAYEYYISIFVLAPFLIGFGIETHASFLYWITSFVAVILIPLPPLALGAILAMLIMRVIGGSKHKEMTTVLGAVGILVLSMLYQIVQDGVEDVKATDIAGILEHISKQFEGTAMVFPNVHFFSDAMFNGKALSLLIAVGIVLAYLVVFWLLAGRIYLAGAIGMQEGTNAAKVIPATQLDSDIKSENIEVTYMKKELRSILRTPAYYLNCLFMTLGWPIVLIVPMLLSASQKAELNSMEKMLFNTSNPTMSVFVVGIFVIGVTLFAASLNSMATSAISREGQGYMIMKQLPIPYVTQLCAKRNAALIVCWVGSGGYMLLASIVLVIMGKFPWWVIPYMLVLNLVTLYVLVNIEMIAGLMHPNLTWESEGNAIQGGFNFFLFLAGVIIMSVVAYSCYGNISKFTAGPVALAAIIIGILAVLAILLEILFRVYGKHKMERL